MHVFYAGPEADPKVFLGVTPGTIVPARGDAVFGWGEFWKCVMQYLIHKLQLRLSS